jgi:hypothetical protein
LRGVYAWWFNFSFNLKSPTDWLQHSRQKPDQLSYRLSAKGENRYFKEVMSRKMQREECFLWWIGPGNYSVPTGPLILAKKPANYYRNLFGRRGIQILSMELLIISS